MTILSWILLAAISLLFSALFSGAEIAFVSSERVEMGVDVSKGGITGRIMNLFFSKPDMFISTILVGNNIVLVIYGMAAAALLEETWLKPYITSPVLLLIICSLISTAVILLVGEFVPKSVFRINPNASLKFFAIPLYLLYLILWPVSAFTAWLSALLMRWAGVPVTGARLGILSIGDLNAYLERTIDDVDALPADVPIETEVKLFHNALEFKQTQLRDCMIPRNELVAVDIADTSRPALSRLFTRSGRSKILVYEGDIDNIRGYIHFSELFNPGADWKERLKPVIYAPETLLADKLMRRMLQEKRSMTIVVDEFGGTAGLVTLEDLVEEIFGEIEDEHDAASLTAEEIAPGVYRFSGRMEVRALRDEYRLDIPEDDDYQTLAGYLLTSLGELPAVGDEITLGRYVFIVRARTATRLDLIDVAPAPEQ